MPLPNNLPKIKLLIGIPSRGTFQTGFGLSLAFLANALCANPVIKVDGTPHLVLWSIQVKNSSNLPGNRQKLVDDALANDLTHLLFVDDDMTFDAEMIFEWLAENRPVIAANCATRGIPTYPTARNQGGLHGQLVYSPLEGEECRTRWERVWRVGTGVMMLRADALRALPRPAFTPRWDAERNDYVGEDWVMCEHLEAAGIPIIIDQQWSCTVGHVGTHTFTHAMVAGQRKLEGPQIFVPELMLSDDGKTVVHNCHRDK